METAHLVAVLAIILGVWYYRKVPDDKSILSENVADEYDYIVVGGGSAGSVLASRLSDDSDVTVLLLEVGGFYDENPDIPIPSFWPDTLLSTQDWKYYTKPQTFNSQGLKGKRAFWPRGRVLGGSSTLNAMQYNRGSRFDYDEWAAGGCIGWSYREVLPYFLKSEDIAIPELKSSKFHSSGGPLTVSSGKLTPLADLYLKAGQELGYDVVDYSSDTPDGFSNIQLNIKNGVRANAALAYLSGTANRNNLDIVLNSFVTKIDIRDREAVGVYFIRNGKKQYVKARKEIVLTAGSLNSPQLLMLSGIGPRDHLSELGIPVHADLPVGENLQDHQFVILRTKIDKPLSRDVKWKESLWNELQYKLFGSGPKSVTGIEVTAFLHEDTSMKGHTPPDYWNLYASFLLEKDFFNYEEKIAKEYFDFGKKNPYGITVFATLARPKSIGSIKLKSTDPFDYPVLDANYFSNKADIDAMVKNIRLWENFIKTKPIKDLGANVGDMKMSFCAKHTFRSDAYWECVIRHVATTVYHHSGTCKMGAATDPTAVVDPHLRVRGIDRLRVADASVFPNVTSGNTNIPTIMVAEKAADLILGKDTVAGFRKKVR